MTQPRVTQAIMSSNGMSSRRTTLKRPIVCKSKKTGDCGDCHLSMDVSADPCLPGQVINLAMHLDCDPDPTDPDFKPTIVGAFTPTTPPPTVIANVLGDWLLQAPAQPGDYIIKISLVNSTKCIFVAELPVSVVP